MQYTLEEIKNILKEEVLINRLELDDVEASDISDDENLFDEDGLALDSVEALDIITGISEIFQVDTNSLTQEEINNNFKSVNDIASFIANNQ
ncbi:hypothetical protein [Streptococcus vestibularis]|uniref:Acyl carrier protein n=1 Tax=Streptococcus vestibularis TaxID=1343 RepID=A0A564T160_STRVE|nr:hypothetical protein [Streptococcus vestibularis]VUX01022.1 acyl carrier protein [Streptococcus vestibularis]